MSFVSTCSRFVKAGILLAGALVGRDAFAQQKPAAPPPRSRNQPFNLSSTDTAAGPAARARAKARANDCEGALPLFDEAVRITIEPTLRRDRGACHDKLGNAQAAIDDYRAYLYARPEAADAKDVEERIQVLEGQLEAARKPEDRGSSGASASASISINGDKTEASAGTKSNDQGSSRGATSYDDYSARVKQRDEAESSSLRMGSGGAFGFYGGVRGLLGPAGTTQVGYNVGVSPRYSFNSWFGLVGELGFAGFGTRAREAIGGIAVWVGPEFRVRLDSYASNSLLFAFGPGFERYSGLDRANNNAFNSYHFRGRIGFRHVFGANIALDLSFDPGVVFLDYDGIPNVITIGGQTISTTPPVDPRALLGGNLAFVVGF